MSEALAAAAKYAPLIGTLVGFIGVVLGLVWNGHLTRVTDERRRTQDADSLRIAVQAEAHQLCDDIAGLLRWVRGPNQPDVWVPIIDYFAVARANYDKLGFLQPREAAAIVWARTTYEREVGNLARVAQKDVIEHAIIGGNLRIPLAGTTNIAHVVDILERIERPARIALAELEKRGTPGSPILNDLSAPGPSLP